MVVSLFHLGQSITYPPTHPSKKSVSFYLDRTREFRLDDQLFIGYVGKMKGKAVHKRTSPRWIILCIKIFYAMAKEEPPEGIRAPSTGAKSSSSALARGVPVIDICKVAAWASLNTFAKHYCLVSEVRTDGYFACSVLQEFLV